MGYQQENWKVSVLVSRHNSPRDEEHDKLWEELLAELEAAISKDKYKPIKPMA